MCRRFSIGKYDFAGAFAARNGTATAMAMTNGAATNGASLYATQAELSNLQTLQATNGIMYQPPTASNGTNGVESADLVRKRLRAQAKKKGVTIVNGTTTIEAFEEDVAEDGTTRVVNAVTRTCELGNVRAPKELWLV